MPDTPIQIEPANEPATPPLAPPLPCIACGYDLATLPLTSNCPECATPIVRTARGDPFTADELHYIRTLRAGAILGTAGAVVWPIAAAFVLLVSVTGISRPFPATMWAIFGVLRVLVVIGFFLFTTPRPHAELANRTIRLRRSIRLFVSLNFGAFVCATVLLFTQSPQGIEWFLGMFLVSSVVTSFLIPRLSKHYRRRTALWPSSARSWTAEVRKAARSTRPSWIGLGIVVIAMVIAGGRTALPWLGPILLMWLIVRWTEVFSELTHLRDALKSAQQALKA